MMTMVSPKAALGIVAGIFGILFVGYWVYVDKQKLKDVDFKQKIKDRRKATKVKCHQRSQPRCPVTADQEDIQAFFLNQVKLGEELLGQGDLDGGIDHLCNAVTICGHPSQILEILQQTLPPNLFLTLLQRIPNPNQRISERNDNVMVEEDVE